MRILDLALLAGFETQESFTRAFKAAFGLTPHRYRKLARKRLFVQKAQIDADYLKHIHQNVSSAPELLEQTPMKLVGLRTYFYGVDSEKNNVGEQLPPLWSAFMARLQEIPHVVAGCCYGVIRQEQEDDERLEYHAAIEVTEFGTLPPGMDTFELPAATYARFAHRGIAQSVDHTVNYIYSNWLPRSGRRHTYGPDLEIYGAQYDATSEESVFYYAIPVSSAAEV